MRIVVLGGTGHLGSAFVRQAAARGDQVTVLSRSSRIPANFGDHPVALVACSEDERDKRRTLFAAADLVVDAAAPYPLYRSDYSTKQAVARMRALVRDIVESGTQLLHIGSFVTTNASHSLRSKISRQIHPYFDVKKAMHDVVLESCALGLRAAIVCPVACLGTGDPKPIEQSVVGLLLQRKLAATVELATSVIDVVDVARLGLAAIEQKRYGESILLAGHPTTAHQLAQRICRLANVPAPLLRANHHLAWGSAVLGELVTAGLGVRPTYAPLSLLLMCETYPKAASKTQAALGIELRPLDTTILEAIAWARAHAKCDPAQTR